MTVPTRPVSRIQALLADAPGWVGGVLVGVQAAALGILVVLAPAFAATAAAPTDDGSAAIDWGSVSVLSIRLWLLGHGVPLVAGSVAFTLVPLGLTLIVAAILIALARRFCTKSWASWAIATGSYVGVVAIVQAIVDHSAGPRIVHTAIVAALVAGPAIALGIWRAYGAEFGWVPRIPDVVRVALRLGSATACALIAAGAVVGAGFTVLGRGRIADATTALGVDPLGGVALAFAESLYTPNLSVWMLGWLTGQGFAVGEGSVYAPATVTTDALPAFPILGALPATAGGALVWAPATIVAVALVIRLSLSRRIRAHWIDLTGVGAAVLVVGAAIALAGSAASGAIGPGRLGVAGVEILPVAATGAGLVALGFGAGHLLAMAWSRWGPGAPPRLTIVRDDADEPATEPALPTA